MLSSFDSRSLTWSCCSYECKLCLTLHNNEGNYLAHTQGKRHQTNLAKRAAREAKEAPAQPQPHKRKVNLKKVGKWSIHLLLINVLICRWIAVSSIALFRLGFSNCFLVGVLFLSPSFKCFDCRKLFSNALVYGVLLICAVNLWIYEKKYLFYWNWSCIYCFHQAMCLI